MNLNAWLLADSVTSSTPTESRLLGIAIWVGVAILTIAMLILMRTRWGQVQPLSKCVVLSVFAHLLLILFAYTTNLLETPRSVGSDEAIQLAFISTDRPPREGGEQVEPTVWDESVTNDIPQVDAVPSPRMEVVSESVQRSSHPQPDDPPKPTMPTNVVEIVEPSRTLAEHQIPTPRRPAPSALEAVPMERPVPQENSQPTAAIVTLPEPIGPQRIDMPPIIPHAGSKRTPSQLPTEVFAMGSRMQQLADVNVRSETADTLIGREDQVSQSDNRGASPIDSSGSAQAQLQQVSSNMVMLPPQSEMARTVTIPLAMLVENAVEATPLRLGDGQPMPAPYRLRSMPQRHEVAASLGGSAKAAAAVDAALAWLAAQQETDGSWDASRWAAGVEHKVAGHDREGAGTDADTGITGLALLAMMANGQSHLEGKYRKNVQHGLEYLLRAQGSDGNLAGPARLYARMYCHGMASLALSEALAMSGDTRIRPYVERAVEYSVNSQHPTTGGWRYQPGDQGDMSQFGWQVMALKSASLAGIATPQQTRQGMLHFLQRCEQGRHGGLCGYRPGTPASRPMTAEALVCRYFLDLAPSDELVEEATEFVRGELPQPGTPNLYYWYYGTLALFQAQGPVWEDWNAAMQRQLLRYQRADGHLAGSWDPNTVWGAYGGRVYSTAMATLCLEVYYRYLPLTATTK